MTRKGAKMGVTIIIEDEHWHADVLYYVLRVDDGGQNWTTRKRFNDFKVLDMDLGSCGCGLSRLRLPSSGCFGLRHRLDICGFNDRRRQQLSAYLEHLAEQIETASSNAIVEQFLHCSQHPHAATTCHSELPCSETTCGSTADSKASVELSVSPKGVQEEARTPKLRVAQQLPTFKTHVELNALEGVEWQEFEASQPTLAATMIDCATLCAKPDLFQNDSERVFSALRRTLRPLIKAGAMEAVPNKVLVWDFLVLFAARRPFYRNQVSEVAKMLDAMDSWREAILEHEDLCILRKEVIPL
mmetsp:Transcript_16814/g.30467  ORF Transcript_16814/g.30467 Transcript_16814/m.30467 type:complete len:300 (+) Transcript_16814:41-940(+)